MKINNHNQQSKNMKVLNPIFAALLAAGLACAGCGTPVTVSGGYQKPGFSVGGTVTTSTNSVTLDGSYTEGTTNVDGSVSVGK
jgi:hypothetical protein